MEFRETAPTLEPPAGGDRPGPAWNSDPSFSRALLAAMLRLKEGDFAVRMPSDLTGVDGKIADAFNDIAAVSERRSRETSRVTPSSARKAS